MKAYINGELLCEIPDCLIVNDTIINKTKTYIIESKTWDMADKELYCKITQISDESTICEMLKEIYKSDHLETSGSNTNNISGNPKTIILMTLAGLIIEPKHFSKNHKSYQSNIMTYWNDKKIRWDMIFEDNPPVHINDLAAIKPMAAKLLTALKIDKKLWSDLQLQ
jgi:hypothetical protein